jgi:hypothetical protein
MSDHPVRRALQRDVLPYLVSARRLKQQWFYRLFVTFGYTTDLVAGLAALGLAVPILTLLGDMSAAPSDAAGPSSLAGAMTKLPGWLALPAGLVVLIWMALRIAFNREDGQKRAVLARSCTNTLRQAEASLAGILSKPDPMPEITLLLEKHIRPSVDRGIQEEAWPWTPFADEIDEEIARRLESLCERYQQDWSVRPDPALRLTA